MLKNICKSLSPELLKVLCEMGHTDEIVIADANFPATSYNGKVIRADGIKAPELLKGILELFPLDTYAEDNFIMMEVVKGDPYVPEIWAVYKEIATSFEGDNAKFKNIDKWEFYERTKKACAVIATGEEALYANIILKKGVIK